MENLTNTMFVFFYIKIIFVVLYITSMQQINDIKSN